MGLKTLEAPVYVNMDLTKHCNFRCFYCSIKDNSTIPISQLPPSHFMSILDRIAEAEVEDVSFFGGEPFLYPHIYELAYYAKKLGMTIGVITNGSLIKADDVKRVVAAFDAGTIALNGLNEVHDKMVGVTGAFDHAIQLIQSLIREGFEVAIDTVVSKSNLQNFDDFLTWIGQNLKGVEMVYINTFLAHDEINPSEVFDLEEFHQALSIIDKHVRGELHGKLMLGESAPWCLFPKEFAYLANSCSPGWRFAGIDAYGNVRMCSWSSVIVGNLLQTPLRTIWQSSEELRHYRSFSWSDRLCTSCAARTYCLGGCHVTASDPPYSLAKQWKKYVKPLSIDELRILAKQPNFKRILKVKRSLMAR